MGAQMQDTKEREKYFFQSEVYLKRSWSHVRSIEFSKYASVNYVIIHKI